MNLSIAIIIGSVIVAVMLGIYYALIAISDSLYTLCKLLCVLRITDNHYTKTEQKGGAE